MSKSSSDLGINRTGAGMSPVDAPRQAAGAAEAMPTSPGSAREFHALCATFLPDAPRIGSVPPPATVRGVVHAAVKAVQAEKPTVFLDALGARLAFERMGARLYEGVITKVTVARAGPPLERLREIRAAELRHFRLLRDTLVGLGADPTAVTPCADVAAVMSTGVLQVVTDPRTTVAQTLDAVLVAELTDTDGWRLLVRLAEERGDTALAGAFRAAMLEEERHVEAVRDWHTELVLAEAGLRERVH
ncbi:MAG: ferritin-like domain-containing protein [Myxococcota bacterium]